MPTQLPNLVVWVRADSIVKSNTNKVSSWINEAGGTNFTQTDSTKQPLWVNNALNGKPIVRFNGTSAYLQSGFSQTFSQPFTVFAVWKISTNAALQFLYDFGTPRNYLYYNSNNIHMGTGTEITYAKTVPFNYIISSCVFNGSSSAIFENGVSHSTGNTGANGLAGMILGSRYSVDQGWLNGDIAEMIVYNRVLSAGERTQVERYLQVRYAPQISLGADTVVSYGFCPVTLTAASGLSNYHWSTGAATNTISVNKSGTYWATASDAFNMLSSDTIQITYAADFHIPDTIICAGTLLNVGTGLTGAYSYLWSTGAITPSISIGSAGTYTVKVTDSNNCFRIDTFKIRVDSLKYRVNLGADTSLCMGNAIALQSGADSVISYFWNDSSNVSSIFVNDSGYYSVTVSDHNGCTATDSIFVHIKGSAPHISFISDTVCNGSVTNFSSTTPVPPLPDTLSYLWNFGNNHTAAGQASSFAFDSSGHFNVSLTVTSSIGCSNSLTQSATVYKNPVAAFLLPSNACLSNAYHFTDRSITPANDSIIHYNWQFGDGASDVSKNTFHTYTATGNEQVMLTVTTQNGCVDSVAGTLAVVASAPSPGMPHLALPLNEFVGAGGLINFSWLAAANASEYVLQISTDASFNPNSIYAGADTTGLNYSLALPQGNYYWRVLAKNICGEDSSSEINSFSLLDISSSGNVVLWLKADGQLMKNGSNKVSSWINEIGGNNLTQTDTTKQPLWVNNALNGKPIIRFNGTSTFLQSSFIQTASQPLTVFAVWKISANAALQFLYDFGTPRNYLYYNSSSIHMGTGTEISYAKTAPFGYIISSCAFNGNSSAIFENGVSRVMGSAGTNGIAGIILGSRFSLDQGWLNGDIAEMIIYNSALSDSARFLVEQYLRFKYAPQINLGPDINKTYGVCDTALNAGTPFTNYSWSNGATAQSIRVKQSNTYWVTANDLFNYLTTDTINVNLPYHGNTSEKYLICLDDSTQLTQLIEPTNAYHFAWKKFPSVAISGDTNSIYVKNEGKYFCLISDTLGCTISSDTTFINVDSFKLFSLLPLTDTTVCGGDEIAVRPYQYSYVSYSWQTPLTTSVFPNGVVDTSGEYFVTVIDTNQCSSSDSIHVTKSWQAPLTDFTANNICLGGTFTFSNNISAFSPDSIYSWSWNFGDGAIDSVQIPSHLYTVTGDYQVTLFLKTDSGCTGVKTKNVSVFAQPHAGFAIPPSVFCAGNTIAFTDQTQLSSGTWHSLWTFNRVDTSTLSNPNYIFSTQGENHFTLIVTSDKGCIDSISDSIQIHPALIANFCFDSVCLGNATVFSDSSIFTDSIESWQWNFADGSASSFTQNTSHAYQIANTFSVQLIITNSVGCVDTISKNVKIAAVPVPFFTAQNTCAGNYYVPQDSSFDLNDSITSWLWMIDTSTYNTRAPQHLFSSAGIYPVTLSITTESGCVNSTTQIVNVHPNPVALFALAPLYGEAPVDITFDNRSVGAAFYQWNFGDGETSLDENPIHTYTQNDTFHISLIAVSDSGCTDSYSQSLSIAPTTLDLSVDDVNVMQTTQPNGYVAENITATVSNLGSRIITSAQLFAILGDGSVIAEDMRDTLQPGTRAQYTFTSSFIVSANDANSYVCVTAESVNGGETETRTDNNRACATLSGAIQFVGPVPNPAADNSVLGIILPKAGKVAIAVVDVAGQYIVEETEFSLHAGRSDYQIPVYKLNAAEYFIRVKYNDDVFVRKLVVGK